jgi:hypothetical protein
MTLQQLDKIINGEAYLEYIGRLFEYSHTEQIVEVTTDEVVEEREHFLDVNDGHEIDFRAETILNCPNHFQMITMDKVSR